MKFDLVVHDSINRANVIKNPIKPLDSEMQVSFPGNHKRKGRRMSPEDMGTLGLGPSQISLHVSPLADLVCILHNKMLILSTAPS